MQHSRRSAAALILGDDRNIRSTSTGSSGSGRSVSIICGHRMRRSFLYPKCRSPKLQPCVRFGISTSTMNPLLLETNLDIESLEVGQLSKMRRPDTLPCKRIEQWPSDTRTSSVLRIATGTALRSTHPCAPSLQSHENRHFWSRPAAGVRGQADALQGALATTTRTGHHSVDQPAEGDPCSQKHRSLHFNFHQPGVSND